jgi:nicotinamide phosphoribosyltransferase
MIDTSLILRTDGYKPSHWSVLPEGTEYVYSYLESRGGKFQSTVQFGLVPYLMYLRDPIDMADVHYAERFFTSYFGDKTIFNKDGWTHIVRDHHGFLPIRIKWAPEGLVIPTHNVLGTFENTCPKCAWVTNYVESLILKTWYPITVATLSREIKKVILGFLEKTGDPAGLPWKLHDFGYRGVSSEESAMIGGMAHLVNFRGSDTIIALEGVRYFYPVELFEEGSCWGHHSSNRAFCHVGIGREWRIPTDGKILGYFQRCQGSGHCMRLRYLQSFSSSKRRMGR